MQKKILKTLDFSLLKKIKKKNIVIDTFLKKFRLLLIKKITTIKKIKFKKFTNIFQKIFIELYEEINKNN